MLANITNRVIVSGDAADVARIQDLVLEPRSGYFGVDFDFDFDFNTVIPMPKFNNILDAYAWADINWGTRINAYGYDEISTEETSPDSYWDFTIGTADSVPEPVFCKLSEMFPEVTIEVYAFNGAEDSAVALEFSKGKKTVHRYYSKKDKQGLRRIFEIVHDRPYPGDEEEVEEEEVEEIQEPPVVEVRVFFGRFARAGNIILPGKN